MDKISIVVPIYNMEKFLEKCLDTLTCQTYENIQIILINDGSTDKSGSICDRYSLQDNRIRVIHKKNEGAGLARNTGLEYVDGKYVIFIDPDDYTDNRMVEVLYDALQERDVDTVISGYYRIDEQENVLETVTYNEELFFGDEILKKCFGRIIGSDIKYKDSIRPTIWSALYSTDIIKNNKVKFCSERELWSEDTFFNFEYYKYSKGVALISDKLYYYRQNDTSLTGRRYKVNQIEKNVKMYNYEKKQLLDMKLYEFLKYRLMRQFFVWFRGCIEQEIFVEEKKMSEKIRNIKALLANEILEELLRDYPIWHTGFKQKIFLVLCKYKQTVLIYILMKYIQ